MAEHRLHTGSVQFIIPSVLAIAAFSISLFFFFMPKANEIAVQQKKESIKELVELPLGICSSFAEKAETGMLDDREARRRAAELIRTLTYGEGDYFWIVDTSPVLIMHPYRPDLEGKNVSGYRDENGTAVFMEMKRIGEEDGEGFVTYNWQVRDETGATGRKLSYVATFEKWGWMIGTGMYLGEVESEISAMRRSMLWVFLAVVFSIAAILLFMVLQGIRVQRRESAAITELKKSRIQYRQLIELMHEGIAMQDDEGRLKFVNRQFCSMLGYPKEEIVGKRTVDFIAESCRETFLEEMEKRERGVESTYETEWKTRSGERLVTLVSPRILHDSSGRRAGSFAAVTDITEWKKSQESMSALLREKTILMKEIHHRVKNNLQMISSLFHMQYENAKDKDGAQILHDSQLRIQTITRVHESLYQSDNLRDIEMRDFLEQLLFDVTAAREEEMGGEIEFITEVESIFFSVDKAIPCGLIVNELLTNSVKHAFDQEGESSPERLPKHPPQKTMGQTEKRVVLFLHRDNESIRFGVEDNGRGLPDDCAEDPAQTLGLELVTVLTEQLEGRISFGTAEEGIGCRVEVHIPCR
ncbi:MAG: cache domain-containing protein [Spirochaetia bacterium]